MSHYTESLGSMNNQDPDFMSHNSDMSSQSSVSMINQDPYFMSHYPDRPLSSKPMIYQYPDVMSYHYRDLPMPSESSSFMNNQYPDFMSHDSDRPMPSQSLGSMFSQNPDFMSHNSDMSSQSSVSMINQNPHFMSHNSDRLMSSKSSVSIINRYPHVISPLKREVHATYRQMKKPIGHRSTWSGFKKCYDWINFDTFNPQRSTVKKKGKEVINVYSEKNVRVEDPGIEESPTVSDHRFSDNNVDVINVEDWDEKKLEFINVDSEKNVRVDDPGIEEIATVSDHRFADNIVDVINVEELEEKALVVPRLQSSIYPRLNEEELDAETSNCKNMEKLFYSLKLNPNVELDAVPEHEKVITCADKVYSDLSSLKSEIPLEEKQLLDPVKKPVKVVPQEAYVPLTKKGKEVINVDSEKNVRVEDPCIEEIATVSDHMFADNIVDVINVEELDEKALLGPRLQSLIYPRLIEEELGAETSNRNNMEHMEKLVYSLSLNRNVDYDAVPKHEKMITSAQEEYSKRLLNPENKPVKVEPQEAHVPLTMQETKKVSSSANRRKVLATNCNSNTEITGEMLQPKAWLNDEITSSTSTFMGPSSRCVRLRVLYCHCGSIAKLQISQMNRCKWCVFYSCGGRTPIGEQSMCTFKQWAEPNVETTDIDQYGEVSSLNVDKAKLRDLKNEIRALKVAIAAGSSRTERVLFMVLVILIGVLVFIVNK